MSEEKKLVTVHYKGHKSRVPVTMPVGVQNLTGITEVRWANPNIDLTPEDAQKLIDLDPAHFELLVDPSMRETQVEPSEDSEDSDPPESPGASGDSPAPKKRKTKKSE